MNPNPNPNTRAGLYAPPAFSRRALRLTARNFLVWRKLMVSSVIVHLIEPVIFFFGLGYGIGALAGEVNGVPYLHFFAAGMAGYAVMNSASFEALYSAFTRMHVQKTWAAILHTPMTLDDIVVGEWLWAGGKSVVAGAAMLGVLSAAGIAHYPAAFLTLPAAVFAGLAFAGIALVFNALAKGYEFFSFYFTLFLTPMMLLSGAFFPADAMPEFLQTISAVLPLRHFVDMLRPLLAGEVPATMPSGLLVLSLYGAGGLWLAVILTRRRYLI
ncbi:MAG: ABC transporter permease [Gammaproteobacteria bacterium]